MQESQRLSTCHPTDNKNLPLYYYMYFTACLPSRYIEVTFKPYNNSLVTRLNLQHNIVHTLHTLYYSLNTQLYINVTYLAHSCTVMFVVLIVKNVGGVMVTSNLGSTYSSTVKLFISSLSPCFTTIDHSPCTGSSERPRLKSPSPAQSHVNI